MTTIDMLINELLHLRDLYGGNLPIKMPSGELDDFGCVVFSDVDDIITVNPEETEAHIWKKIRL